MPKRPTNQSRHAMNPDNLRQYLVFAADKAQMAPFTPARLKLLFEASLDILRSLGASQDLLDSKSIEAYSAPSADLRYFDSAGRAQDVMLSNLVISYRFTSLSALQAFRAFLDGLLRDGKIGAAMSLKNFGADPRAFVTCSTFPETGLGSIGTRAGARRSLGASALAAKGLRGRAVNVAIIDRGLNREALIRDHANCWGGGLAQTGIKPGSAPITSHGMLVARNVLDIAPEATLYDVPLIPSHILHPECFASDASAVLEAVLNRIHESRQQNGADEAWVLVNAWGIYDRSSEWPVGDYTENRHVRYGKDASGSPVLILGHPLNNLMQSAVDQGIDVVFAAGNCGQFSLDPRCRGLDRGARHSIWGANGHSAVITVGAASIREGWMGYSAQGPLSWADARKPDLCAPSQFREEFDSARLNTGTSTAAALAAGVVAAIRSNHQVNWGPIALPPPRLKEAMIAAARGQGGIWNGRTGHGMLDAGSLIGQLDVIG